MITPIEVIARLIISGSALSYIYNGGMIGPSSWLVSGIATIVLCIWAFNPIFDEVKKK